MHLSVNKRRTYKTTWYTQFQKALPILWNVCKGTAFVWNVGTKWGKLLRKQNKVFIMEVKIISWTDTAWQSWLTLKTMHSPHPPVIEVYCIMCSFLGSNSESRILLDFFITSMKNQCKRNEWKFGRNVCDLFMTVLQCVHGHPKTPMSLTDFFSVPHIESYSKWRPIWISGGNVRKDARAANWNFIKIMAGMLGKMTVF